MRLFTDGRRAILRTAAGRIHWSPGSEPTIVSSEASHIADDRRGGILAVTPLGQDYSEAMERVGAVDGVVIDDATVAAVIAGDQDEARLVLGSPHGDWKRNIALAAVDAIAVTWPKALAKTKKALSSAPGLEAATASLSVNSHGYCVACRGTGIVAVVRPDGKAVDFALRLPCHDDGQLYAEPTSEGVLVTLSSAKGDSAILHLSETGEVLASIATRASPPALLMGNETVLIHDQEAKCVRLTDSRLEEKSNLELPMQVFESTCSDDGLAFAFANGNEIALGELSQDQLVLVDRVDYAAALDAAAQRKEVAKARGNYDPKRAHGSPCVGFPTEDTPPWSAQASQPFTLHLVVRSTGGKGRGLYVQLEGDALERADWSHVVVGDQRADLVAAGDGLRAELPDVPLVAGFRYPLEPAPKTAKQKEAAKELLATTHIGLEVHGKAKAPSRDLLRVTVGALDSRATAMKWMRPLTITEG